jgi:transcriptional adapter 2-alpha
MCRKRKRDASAVFQPGRYDCANCRRNLRGEKHLRHTDGDNADLALCTDCYTVGVEVQGAKWEANSVRVVDTAATGRPLLVEDWLADQEVGLLEGILQFGFGNWRAIAEHMGGDKTEQSCEDHYERFYLRSKAFPLPDLTGPPQPTTSEAAPEAEASGGADEAKGTSKADVQKRGASGQVLADGQVATADLVGYMPLRGEYDTEWENDAELAICEIEISGAETADELQEKLTQLHAYNKQLDERQRRRDFVQKHDLQERMARHHAMDRRLSREERQFRTAMRPYAQRTSVEDHERCANGARTHAQPRATPRAPSRPLCLSASLPCCLAD